MARCEWRWAYHKYSVAQVGCTREDPHEHYHVYESRNTYLSWDNTGMLIRYGGPNYYIKEQLNANDSNFGYTWRPEQDRWRQKSERFPFRVVREDHDE